MDDRGVSTTLVGLVGIGTFVIIIGSVLVSTQTLSSGTLDSDVTAASRDLQSQALASIVLDATGFAPDGPSTQDWIHDPDAMVKFGLLDDPGSISFAKLENLRLAPFEADATDGYVNYEEAHAAIGNPLLDFHIRAAPSLQSVRDILATGLKDTNWKVTYIGDIDVTTNGQSPPADPTAGLTVSTPTCAISPLSDAGGDLYRFEVTVTNGGVTDTQFNSIWTFDLGSETGITRTSNSYIVADGGASTTLYVDIPAYSAAGGGGVPTACAAGTTMTVDIMDTSTTLTTVSKTFTAGDEVTATTAAPHDLFVATHKTHYVDPGATCSVHEEIEIEYGSLTADKNTDTMALRVVDPATGDTVWPTNPGPSWHEFNMANQLNKREINIGCLSTGEYEAIFQFFPGASASATDLRVTERVLVAASSVGAFTPAGSSSSSSGNAYYPSDAAVAEIQIIDGLVQNFCHTYYESDTATGHPTGEAHSTRCGSFKGSTLSGQPGDVFPDIKSVMNNDLVDRLIDNAGQPRYDETNTLIVGSNVQHNSMTSSSAKHAVRDWVYGGGNLIVLGSLDQSVNWLQPIFHSGIKSSSGGIGTPDPQHPVLRIPDEMDWQGYGNPNGNAWNFNAGSDQYFTFVVAQGSDAILAVSNPGAFQQGNVFLTTFIPHDPYGTGTSGVNYQGQVMVNNLLSLGYRDLFLDYGPPLPDKASIAPGVRTATVEHPDLGPVSVTFTVFVF